MVDIKIALPSASSDGAGPLDPKVAVWHDRIERSKRLRKKAMKEAKLFIDFYEGKQWGKSMSGLSEKLTVNLIFNHVKTQIPTLYFTNPKFFCNPKRMEVTAEQADAAQRLLNYYLNEENRGVPFKMQMRLAILDAFFSFGAIKAGNEQDFDENPQLGKRNIMPARTAAEVKDALVTLDSENIFDSPDLTLCFLGVSVIIDE